MVSISSPHRNNGSFILFAFAHRWHSHIVLGPSLSLCRFRDDAVQQLPLRVRTKTLPTSSDDDNNDGEDSGVGITEQEFLDARQAPGQGPRAAGALAPAGGAGNATPARSLAAIRRCRYQRWLDLDVPINMGLLAAGDNTHTLAQHQIDCIKRVSIPLVLRWCVPSYNVPWLGREHGGARLDQCDNENKTSQADQVFKVVCTHRTVVYFDCNQRPDHGQGVCARTQ
jgi:hypothetical protein